MLTREQVYTMLMLRSREGNIFSGLQKNIIEVISDCGQDSNNQISKALTHAAYARQEDVDALLAMLAINPRLLLQAGNVKTPGGLDVQRVTIYEFLLGAGDIDLANLVIPYFSEIPGGEAERERQLERYRPHLDGMLMQTPYPVQPIFDLLLSNKASIREDVSALLENNLEHKSELCDAIMAFRNAHIPTKPLIKPRMHFNYATQNLLYQTLYEPGMRSALYKSNGNNDNMNDLIWLKMICHLMNFYPGIDRCITAQGVAHIYQGIAHIYTEVGVQAEVIKRSYQLRYGNRVFPSYGVLTDLGALGVNYGISIYGTALRGPAAAGGMAARPMFSRLISNKSIKIAEHIRCATTSQRNQVFNF